MVVSNCASILVAIALPEEHDQLLEKFPSEGVETVADHLVFKHKVPDCGVELFSVLAADMGTDAAFDAVEAAIEKINPNFITCIGIAGSISSDLKVGDVVSSAEIVDVSQNMKIVEKAIRSKFEKKRKRKRTTPKTTTKIELSPKVIPVATEISSSFRFLRSHPVLKERLAEWAERADARRRKIAHLLNEAGITDELEKPPAALTGAIISGPVVASPAFRETLKAIDRKVLAVETESAGIFRASQKRGINCVTIRGISDHADLSKNTLERTTKDYVRRLAMQNALDYFELQFSNPAFMNPILSHFDEAAQSSVLQGCGSDPAVVLRRVSADLDAYLDLMSPEYKHKPRDARLPIPRVSKDLVDEYTEFEDMLPKSIYEALQANPGIFLRIPKSFPNQTLAWTIGQYLLVGELDGKQILPLVLSGDEISPPRKGVAHATNVDVDSLQVRRDFSQVVIVNEPEFRSQQKLNFLISELERLQLPVLVISRAEQPTDKIDLFKERLGLIDFSTAPAPLREVAAYLEAAFEMGSDEADAVATRLDDTFSKFRLHTHPAYFVGINETAIEALIQANHRAELIQLAVSGLLSFVVALDTSPVPLQRTTREEFLTDLAYEIRVKHRSFSKSDLKDYVTSFATHKALEVEADQFLEGFFKVGLLAEIDDEISFPVQYLEAYLLAERLRTDADVALNYFNPENVNFDYFAFDLYVERGGSSYVSSRVCEFSRSALADCSSDENVFEAKRVRPRVLENPHMLVHAAKQLNESVSTIAGPSNALEARTEKQRLIDTRQAVRGQVASRDPMKVDVTPEVRPPDFVRLDRLSRASTLLASLIGAGAERLSGEEKREIARLTVKTFERFLHHWTENRLGIDIHGLRGDLMDDQKVRELIEDLGIFVENIDEFRDSFLVFLDDQEVRLLSGPAYSLFSKLSQQAGVRSLLPIFKDIEVDSIVEKIFRDVWLMDVEHATGKKSLKETLSQYKGSPMLRLSITTHLMNRVFWHHWQRDSRTDFIEVARYSLRPLGLLPSQEYQSKMIAGKKR